MPGCIEVTYEQSPKRGVLATPGGVPYLVHDSCDREPSETRELPEYDFDPGPGGSRLTPRTERTSVVTAAHTTT